MIGIAKFAYDCQTKILSVLDNADREMQGPKRSVVAAVLGNLRQSIFGPQEPTSQVLKHVWHEALHPDNLSYFFAHCNVPDYLCVYDMPTMIKQFM